MVEIAVPQESGRELALTFEAFLATHARKWLAYAYLHTGSRTAAREVTLAAYEQLGRVWPHALRQASVEAYAWSVLKERVTEWLYDRRQPTALTETAAFAVVTQALLRECQQQFAMLESQLGLYAAIARLPAAARHRVRRRADRRAARGGRGHRAFVREPGQAEAGRRARHRSGLAGRATAGSSAGVGHGGT